MASSSGGVPPGFRFHPTDEELLHYYLKKKVSFQKFDMEVIREVDLNKLEPWDLQERCRIGSTPQNEWYFFSHKDRKYPTGSRTNRATNAGFWKATGRDKCIRNTFKKIGMRKTLVFYRGRAPHGQKTDWIMHEYRLEEQDHDPNLNSSSEDGWVVCRVFKKKNLFKVGSSNDGGGGGGGSSTINSEITTTTHHQYLNSTNTNNTNYSTSHNSMQASTQYYLLRQPPHNLMQQQPPTFELNNKPPPPHPPPPPYHELALHYPPHTHLDHLRHYSQLPLIPNAYGPAANSNLDVHAKQLMIANAAARADCESGSDVSGALRGYQLCEPGLEVGTSTQHDTDHHLDQDQDQDHDHDHDQQQGDHHQAQAGMAAWPTMLDRIVSQSAANNNDAVLPSASVSAHIHHLSLRATASSATGEMDFWGYAK